jgi:hypothetical protein
MNRDIRPTTSPAPGETHLYLFDDDPTSDLITVVLERRQMCGCRVIDKHAFDWRIGPTEHSRLAQQAIARLDDAPCRHRQATKRGPRTK